MSGGRTTAAAIEIWQIEVFCAVYEERSFSRAADRLELAQPTVSGHIKALESLFGMPLLDRLGRETVPTLAGDLLYRHGLRMLEARRHALEEMSQVAGGVEGKLRIVASTIAGEFLLPEILARFGRRWPKVRVEAAIGDSREVLRAVEEGRVDLGLAGAVLDSDLDFTPFASDRLVLTVPASERWAEVAAVSLDELRSAPLVLRERGSGTRAAIERHLAEHGLRLADFQVAAELGSTSAVKEAVRCGLGWSILSELAVRTEVAAGLLRTPSIAGIEPWRRDFYVVRDRRRSAPPTVAGFLELLRDGKTDAP